MKIINDENIDELMFRLLEGEISGSEKEQLLDAINSDEAYSRLWRTWQHTRLSDKEVFSMDTNSLKKKRGLIIPLYLKYAVAAMLVLAISVVLILSFQKENASGIAVDLKPKPKSPSQVPYENIQPSVEKRDTTKSLKDVIRNLAHEDKIISDSISKPTQMPVKQAPVKEEIIIVANQKIPEQLPVIEKTAPVEIKKPVADDVSYTVSTLSFKPAEEKKEKNLFAKIFGKPRLRLESDSSTFTNKRLIIENKKIQIIAGF